MGGMVGSNVLANILKPVNIVNLGNTWGCGVGKPQLQNLWILFRLEGAR